VVVKLKGQTQMHLNVNHALLNNNMQKEISKIFKTLMCYIVIIGWKTCNLSLTCNWFNQNIKSLSDKVWNQKQLQHMFLE
jgi:hypothetical protein